MSLTFAPIVVGEVRRETRDAIVVTFDVPLALRERYRFTQGQYVTLEAEIDGERVRRPYSICAPAHEGRLRVAIKRVAGGRFSTWAHATLAPGMTLDVAPPEGRFFVPLAPDHRKHYLAFAAGSGITPVFSLVATTLALEPQSRFTLVYGNRSSATTMFARDLQNLKDRYLDRFALFFVTSREPQEFDLLHGRIDADTVRALAASWIDLATVDAAFVCGPDAMNAAVPEALAAEGIARERIKVERFTPAAHANGARPRGAAADDAERAGDGPVPVEAYAQLDGRRRTFAIEGGGRETVLAAGLRQGLDLPYSCRSGVCSTCRVALVEGEVEMDAHDALEDYEIARGYILLCQSYPLTPTLGIDVDARGRM
jgi:ring-1,2-phenylacetyl-CoA epoxidase subunit PaaE